MTHAGSGQRKYFRCNNHSRKARDASLVCHPNYTRIELIIDAVDAHIAKLKAHSPAELRAAIFDDEDERAALERERAVVEQRVQNISAREQRLGDAVADGVISSDTARAAQVKISQDKDTVAWELARIDEQLVLLPDESERHMRVELIAAMPDSVRLLQEDEARVLLRDVGVMVWCENREVVRVEPEIE